MEVDLAYDLSSLCGPIDFRVVAWLEDRNKLDPSYLAHVQRWHGGIPGLQYFNAEDGRTYRVGRFLTLVNEQSVLEPPFRPSWQTNGRDGRIEWSVETLIDQEGPTHRFEDDC